jgi:GTP-binding protein
MLNSIAILGRPNVGKSSLFNKLTKSRNAIVSDFSGLTKDRNFGYASIKDHQYLVIDTGGVGSEITEFSSAITQQALIAAEDSSLILLLIDGSEELTSDDIDLYQYIRKMNKKFFVVLNKIDIKKRSNAKEDLLKFGCGDILEISAEHSRGIKELQTFISQQFVELSNAADTEDLKGTKIAVIGRPNAGKSTFINQFTKQDRLIVSDVPGTTIDSIHVPFIFNDENFIFIDTAGIRKKYKQSHAVEYFSYVRAMHAVDESDIVLMLIDASDGIVDQDLRILNLIRGYGKPVVVALNKIDELSANHLLDLKETKKFQNSALNDLILVEISALQKRGFKKLFDTLAKVNQLAKTKFSTGKLNKLLLKFTNSTNTPSISGRQIKMRYIHFGGIHPTKFIIHSNFSSKIPSNYKRYLINSFRDELKLNSVELSIIFKKGENPFEGKKNELSSRQIKKKKRLIKHIKKSKK